MPTVAIQDKGNLPGLVVALTQLLIIQDERGQIALLCFDGTRAFDNDLDTEILCD